MPPLLAFTTDHVRRLTGLSPRVLRYWEETDVFHASYTDDHPRRPYRRLYSFRDVVSLRTLALLRRQHNVELDELRKVGRFLAKHADASWASLRFRLAGRHVVFDDPETGVAVSGRPLGQAVIPFELEEIAREAEADAKRLRERVPEDFGRIARHRYVLHNAWVVAGTRIPTSAIWSFAEEGYDSDAIMREYPQLQQVDIDAAIAHERRLRQDAAA
jgi:DNA-binding transcriptional MerR regulator